MLLLCLINGLLFLGVLSVNASSFNKVRAEEHRLLRQDLCATQVALQRAQDQDYCDFLADHRRGLLAILQSGTAEGFFGRELPATPAAHLSPDDLRHTLFVSNYTGPYSRRNPNYADRSVSPPDLPFTRNRAYRGADYLSAEQEERLLSNRPEFAERANDGEEDQDSLVQNSLGRAQYSSTDV